MAENTLIRTEPRYYRVVDSQNVDHTVQINYVYAYNFWGRQQGDSANVWDLDFFDTRRCYAEARMDLDRRFSASWVETTGSRYYDQMNYYHLGIDGPLDIHKLEFFYRQEQDWNSLEQLVEQNFRDQGANIEEIIQFQNWGSDELKPKFESFGKWVFSSQVLGGPVLSTIMDAFFSASFGGNSCQGAEAEIRRWAEATIDDAVNDSALMVKADYLYHAIVLWKRWEGAIFVYPVSVGNADQVLKLVQQAYLLASRMYGSELPKELKAELDRLDYSDERVHERVIATVLPWLERRAAQLTSSSYHRALGFANDIIMLREASPPPAHPLIAVSQIEGFSKNLLGQNSNLEGLSTALMTRHNACVKVSELVPPQFLGQLAEDGETTAQILGIYDNLLEQIGPALGQARIIEYYKREFLSEDSLIEEQNYLEQRARLQELMASVSFVTDFVNRKRLCDLQKHVFGVQGKGAPLVCEFGGCDNFFGKYLSDFIQQNLNDPLINPVNEDAFLSLRNIQGTIQSNFTPVMGLNP